MTFETIESACAAPEPKTTPGWDGVFPDLAHAAYHERRLGVVSKSALDHIARSPAHYKAWFDGEDETSDALEFGSAFHCAMLEPERFARQYAEQPDFGDCRRTDNRTARDAWRMQNAGKRIVSADDLSRIHGMCEAVRSHPLGSKMIANGTPELTIRWTDQSTGLRCQSRADYYVESLRMVVDVKSIIDARLDHFRRDVVKYRYHVQDAMYRRAFAAAGLPVEHFVFLAVEKAEPFAVGIFSLDRSAVARGDIAAEQDIQTMAECVKRDEWPGYQTSIQVCELPPWAA
jgi:hypothetical protein